jgi:hypothetical protein
VEPKNQPPQSEVDLFGRPSMPLKDPRGRKSYKKTPQNQAFVENRAAEGITHEEIAAEMGIDAKTLRKYYSPELSSSRLRIIGEMVDVLRQRARQGNVAAAKTLLDRYEDAAPLAPRNRRAAEEDDDDQGQDTPLGKKEQAVLEAQKVPDNYGDIFSRLKGRH